MGKEEKEEKKQEEVEKDQEEPDDSDQNDPLLATPLLSASEGGAEGKGGQTTGPSPPPAPSHDSALAVPVKTPAEAASLPAAGVSGTPVPPAATASGNKAFLEDRKTSLPIWRRKDSAASRKDSVATTTSKASDRLGSFAEESGRSRASMRPATSLDAISHHRVSATGREFPSRSATISTKENLEDVASQSSVSLNSLYPSDPSPAGIQDTNLRPHTLDNLNQAAAFSPSRPPTWPSPRPPGPPSPPFDANPDRPHRPSTPTRTALQRPSGPPSPPSPHSNAHPDRPPTPTPTALTALQRPPSPPSNALNAHPYRPHHQRPPPSYSRP
ncbi:uncharacterized protein LOC134776834 [Penaeus indicus]|uniref:uncharacterized protein LOC134776834 n=1 Tax=Penaeus indicus TaxID=29960 RepID=UPI00300D31AA